MDEYSIKEILKIIGIEYNTKSISKVYKIRKDLGIKDPKFFDQSFLNDVDTLILSGKCNLEIYQILQITLNQRISDMMARRRKLLNIPNNNFTKGNKEEYILIKEMILKGFSNNDILKNIGKDRTKYYINLFGKMRKEIKNITDRGSSTIESIT